MSSLTDFKRPVWQGADVIARHWLEALRVSRVAPAGEDAEGPLPGSILLVLDEILRVTELDDSKIEHEEVCSAAPTPLSRYSRRRGPSCHTGL